MARSVPRFHGILGIGQRNCSLAERESTIMCCASMHGSYLLSLGSVDVSVMIFVF